MVKNRVGIVKYLVSFMLTASYLSTPVYADNDFNDIWKVKQFVSDGEKFMPYCTLNRQYKDIILAIAKNEDGMSKIAVEATKTLLNNTDKSKINASLETDYIKKDIIITPVTKSAFMIKLQIPNEIDAILKDIKNLKISSESLNRDISFKINNINEATGKLEECLSDLKNKKHSVADNVKASEPAKDAKLLEELTKKDIEIRKLKRELATKQKQLEEAPLYKQAKTSSSFKNLNIAHLDQELIKKQEDIERQVKTITEQQEWVEKERLKVKKLQSKSLDEKTRELLEAKKKIAKLEKEYKAMQATIASMQKDKDRNTDSVASDKKTKIMQTKKTNIIWTKDTDNIKATKISKSDKKVNNPEEILYKPTKANDFVVLEHIPISKRKLNTRQNIEEIELTSPEIKESNTRTETAEKLLLDKISKLHKEQKQLSYIPTAPVAPIKLIPPKIQSSSNVIEDRTVTNTTVISAEDTLPNIDISDAIGIKKDPNKENNKITLTPPKQGIIKTKTKNITHPKEPKIIHLSAPKREIVVDTTYVIDTSAVDKKLAKEDIVAVQESAIKLVPPKGAKIVHLPVSTPEELVPTPKRKIVVDTIYVIDTPVTEKAKLSKNATKKEIKLTQHPQISEKTKLLTLGNNIDNKDSKIILKSPKEVIEDNNDKLDRLSFYTVSNTPQTLQEKDISTVPEPISAFEQKTVPTKKAEITESSPYEALLDTAIKIHKEKSAH